MPTEPLTAFPIWDQRAFNISSSTCAVLMPFDDPPMERVYQNAMVAAIRETGLEPVRADRSSQPKVVEYIWVLLNQARMIVADITGSNPNVLYELGVSHTLGKPTVILRSDPASMVPFDVRGLRSIKYARSDEGLEELKVELSEAIRALVAAYPTGYRLLDELEDAARLWRGPSREFGLLYSPDRLSVLQRHLQPESMSDYAIAFCAASACQWGSAGHMVHWGHLCNARPAAASDLGFGLFNHQRRPRLRIAYLLSQMDTSVRHQVVAQVSEHGLKGEILDAILGGDIPGYVDTHRESFGLSPGELGELTDLFHNSQLVFRRPLP